VILAVFGHHVAAIGGVSRTEKAPTPGGLITGDPKIIADLCATGSPVVQLTDMADMADIMLNGTS
jgi:hypothetical protein